MGWNVHPDVYTSDFHNSVPFRLWEKTSVHSQEMWGLASLAFLETTVMLYSQMENHFPRTVALKGLVFSSSHLSAYHISCMNIRIWWNLTLAYADMESVTQMSVAIQAQIDTGEVSLFVCSCLPTSVHSLKFLKENKEHAPVILTFLYRNTLSLSGKCLFLNNRVPDLYNYNWLSSAFIRNYSAGWQG